MVLALEAMLHRQPRQWPWVFTARPSARCPQSGRQISDRRALAHFRRVLKGLALKGRLHTFRHSFISHALTTGVAEAIVRTWVGHVDQRIMRTYTHIADGISQEAMKKLFVQHEEEAKGRQASA
jgi:integrase